MQKVAKVVQDLATSPPIALSAGNLLLASQTAEPLGVILNAATLATTVGLRTYESITQRQIGLPYYVLSAINGYSAASVLLNGANSIGAQELLQFNTEAVKYLTSAAAFAGWSAGHAFAGINQARKERLSGVLSNEQTWYGIGDLAAVQANPYSSVFFALGLGNSLLRTSPDQNVEVQHIGDFLQKHVTSARLYGMGYILGSLVSLHDPAFAGAQAAWGVGYLNFDAAKNAVFLKDLKQVIRSGVDNIATTLIERHVKGEDLFEPQADGCTLNIRDLIIAGFGTADKFRLGLGFQTDRLWENAGQTAVRLYPATSLENREKAFTLLEVLAPKSAIVRSAIVQWAKEGDPLSIQKMRRLGELVGGGVRLTHPRQNEIFEAERLLAKIGLD